MNSSACVSLAVVCVFVATQIVHAQGRVKLSPKIHTSKVKYRDTHVEFDIQPFIAPLKIFDERTLKKAPQVDAILNGLSGKTDGLFVVKDLEESLESLGVDKDTRDFGIYRINNDSFKSYDEEESLGYGSVMIGQAKIEQSENDEGLTILKVIDHTTEILVDDLLFPKDEGYLDLKPSQLDKEVTGAIVDVIDTLLFAGVYQFVFVDVGSEDGVAPGHLMVVRANPNQDGLRVDLREKTIDISDISLERSIGTIMLFRVYEKGSYGLITKASQGFRKHDFISNQ